MATTTVAPMTAMEAHTLVLLNHADTWSRGYRTTDGLQFVLFAGSAGQTYLSSESGCTCRGFFYRGTCAHQNAVSIEAERARARALAPKRRALEEIWTDDMESSF